MLARQHRRQRLAHLRQLRHSRAPPAQLDSLRSESSARASSTTCVDSSLALVICMSSGVSNRGARRVLAIDCAICSEAPLRACSEVPLSACVACKHKASGFDT